MGFDPKPQQNAAGNFLGAKQELQTGPFVLRSLLDNVPLSEDGDNDDIKINCVDYLGMEGFSISPCSNMLTLPFQRGIYTSVPQPQSSSTSFKSLPVLPTSPLNPSSFSPRDCARVSPRAQSPETPSRVFSRSYCSPRFKKHVCCATIPSPFILCQS